MRTLKIASYAALNLGALTAWGALLAGFNEWIIIGLAFISVAGGFILAGIYLPEWVRQ